MLLPCNALSTTGWRAFPVLRVAFDLTPALVGVLRFLARNPGSSQRELADAIGMPASRLVAMADELERRELVMRVRDEHDRRSHRITLTAAGKAQLEAIAKQAQEHKRELLSALSVAEQEQLEDFLQRIALEQGLKRGVHPGLTRGRPS
jgi:DNA-binding MarR family transcriptional regulator